LDCLDTSTGSIQHSDWIGKKFQKIFSSNNDTKVPDLKQDPTCMIKSHSAASGSPTRSYSVYLLGSDRKHDPWITLRPSLGSMGTQKIPIMSLLSQIQNLHCFDLIEGDA
jgi:hypothetical protein